MSEDNHNTKDLSLLISRQVSVSRPVCNLDLSRYKLVRRNSLTLSFKNINIYNLHFNESYDCGVQVVRLFWCYVQKYCQILELSLFL